ncbi:MAG TPA: AI-2E family transporter [Anaerolineae bacterium]|nr:AI-2E family transporter [Anaerolineae bacterium]
MQTQAGLTKRYFVLTLGLALLVLIVYLVRGLLGPLVIAALLAYILKPLTRFFTERLRMRTTIAAALVYALFLAMLIASLVLLAPVLIRQGHSLVLAVQDFTPRLEAALAEPINIMGITLQLDGVYANIRDASSALFAPDRVFHVIMDATTNIAWVLVIFVATYYLLQDWEKLRDWFIGLFPESQQSDIRHIHAQIKEIWRAYLRGQLLLMLVIGILSALSAAIIGLPNALLLGLIAGGLDFVPSLGPAVATAIAALIAWTQGSIWLPISPVWFVVLVVVVYQCIQLLESIWLQPRILGTRLRMHRGVVFVAVITALTLGSILLALIIVPLIASIGIITQTTHRWMLGLGDPPPPTSASDLPASDSSEATEQ